VAFASAYDCWSFTLPSFLPNVAQKLGMNAKALQKFMWGDFYFANKQVTKLPPSPGSKIMFVQFILDPLVEKYNKVFSKEVMKSTALIREAHSKIKDKLSKLMPTEFGIFKMVIENLPSPQDAQETRLKQFCPALLAPGLQEPQSLIRDAINKCDQRDDAPTVVYVTKMQPFSSRLYDITTRSLEKSVEKQRLIAVSRVFSGTLKVG
jgi:translation elongation factor EF-G